MSRGLRPGAVIAGYRLLSLVGNGATGTVFLAEHVDTSERVALKVLDSELARDERFRKRLLRESTIAAQLTNEHVVPIVDFGESGDDLYLAMRYVDGPDLRELLEREGALDPERTLALLAQIAEALDAAHENGLIHRDVKPANILVEPAAQGERAYLCDFGLAKHASTVSSLTGEHAFVGTLAYVSPEQIKGDDVDGRTDVYALGCVLYECLAGAPPFDRESELAVVYAHLHERTPRLTDARPDLPEPLDRVIRTATAKAPGDRFGSCAELIRAARAALAGERPRRRGRVALAVLTAAAVAAVGVVAFTRGGDEEPKAAGPRLAVGGPGVALVDASTRRVAARVRLPEPPIDIVFGGRSAWALLGDAQQVAQVDLKSRRVVGTVKLPFAPGGIAIAGNTLFVTEDGGAGGVVRIDTSTRKAGEPWMVPTRGFRVSEPAGIAAGAGSVWLARGAEVVRIDAGNGAVQHRFPLPVTATLVAFGEGAVWAVSSEDGLVEKIDPATNRIAERTKLRGWVSALAVGGGSVWATATPDDRVTRLSQDDASVQQTLAAGRGPESVSIGGGATWIANARGRMLTRIDAGTGARTAIAVTGQPYLVREHDGLLWTAADPAPPALEEVDGPEIRVAIHDGGLELDPAFGPFPQASQLLYSTCMKLMNYPDAAGAAGEQLTPDAAAEMPLISADGRTYTFRIRSGLRFSPPSGEVLDAETFRHTLERTIAPTLGPDTAGLHAVGDIVGAREFNAGKAPSVRGIVARGDQLTITLEKPAGDLLSRLAMPITCAVPKKTPEPGSVRGLIASAGPYYVRATSAAEIVLDRNPNYHGRRPRRPARITYLIGVPTARAVALADAGRVDVVPFDFDVHGPLAPGGALDRRHSQETAETRRDGTPRYHKAAAPGLDLLTFNTKQPLFKDTKLRQAVNYAIDRPALAKVFGEDSTDRYIPPGIPGPAGAAVYPLAGPDLAAARRLAGTGKRREADLYVCGEPVNLRIAEIVRDNLAPIGIDVRVVESDGCLRGPDPKAARSDILLSTLATPELDPAPFLEATVGDTLAFGPGHGPDTFDDAAVRAKLEAASALTGPDRLAAYARLDEELVRDEAPYAAYASFVAPEYLSERTSCRLPQGAYHVIDLGALCIRSD